MTGKKVEILFLSQEDMIKAGVLDTKKCVEAIDEMFKLVAEGDYLMGGPFENDHGIRIYFPINKRFPNMPVAGPDRRFMAMVAYLGGRFNVCVDKWYGSNIANSRLGLPRSIHTITLNNVETGEPLAFMSGNLVSNMRTGAVPAVGAKYLASDQSEIVGMVGGGVISKATLRCLAYVMKNLKKVKIYDIKMEKGQEYAQEMSKEIGIPVVAVGSIEETVLDADFVNIATAGTVKPLIKEEWLKENVVLSSLATADLSDHLLSNSTIVVDEWKLHQSWKHEEDQIPPGEAAKKLAFPSMDVFRLIEAGKIKEKDIRSLGPIAAGKTPGRRSEKERFILIIGGLPIEDAAWAYTVYQDALKMGIGQKLTLWNAPHWY